MSGNSNYFGQQIEGWLNGTQMPTPPSALYVALFNGDPTDAGTSGTEVSTTIRTAGRVQATFGAPSTKTITNTSVVSFGASAGATTITHFAVYNAASNGNMLFSAPLTSGSGAVSAGTTVSFAVGALSYTN